MNSLRLFFKEWVIDFYKYLRVLSAHLVKNHLSPKFAVFESFKTILVGKMYSQRGKNAQRMVNVAVVTVMVFGVALGPSLVVNDSQTQAVMTSGFGNKFVFAQGNTGTDGSKVLGLSADTQMSVDPLTTVSDKPRADILDYTVVQGDTLASIAKMFGVDIDSINWLNPGLNEKKIKPGSVLHIPPVTGVVHTVKSGETIYTIAKKYDVSAQSIVDFPFNEFTNDETFALAIGQQLIVPDGVMPAEVITSPRSNLANVLTPNAGSVAANGHFIWPTQGSITQSFKQWHKGVDIANHSGGNILAADSGTIVHAGWVNSGYGNMIMIDHGNGYMTLYGHMLANLHVTVGQTVKRGDVIGSMGSTGRSTGTHLHFEIRTAKGNVDPLSFLSK